MDKYKIQKQRSQEVIPKMRKHISESVLNTMIECGRFWAFAADNEYNKKRAISGISCKNRFCPLCSWRKAKKDALAVATCMKWIKAEHGKDFIFLTLTVVNVEGNELKSAIDKFNKDFKKLSERKEFGLINQGYVRKLEITYNKEMNTYHPHFHVLMAVNASYFKSRYYLSQARWLELWRESTGDERIVALDVRRVKENDGKEVNEIAKYAAKSDDLAYSQDVFDVFYAGLKGRQLITFNSLFAEAHKKFKAGQLNDFIERDETVYVNFLLYRWGSKAYEEELRRMLTPEEYKKYNKKLIDELEVEEE